MPASNLATAVKSAMGGEVKQFNPKIELPHHIAEKVEVKDTIERVGRMTHCSDEMYINITKEAMEVDKIVSTDPDAAIKATLLMLDDAMDHPAALFVLGRALFKGRRYGLGSCVYEKLSRLLPERADVWSNLGCCYEGLREYDLAEKCFIRATNIQESGQTYESLANVYLNTNRHKLAEEIARKATSLDDKTMMSDHNLSLALLAQRKWAEGWEKYATGVGKIPARPLKTYQNEVRWDGNKVKTLLLYPDQGIGDELGFIQLIPEIKDKVETLIIECDPRLEGVFRRSYPWAHIYGTRKNKPFWVEAYKIDASCPISELGLYTRNSEESFKKDPYLIPDPERVIQWKALLDSISNRPKIGIAWTGGVKDTGKLERSATLEALHPILMEKADFISLEYKDPQDEISDLFESRRIKVHHWQRGTMTNDYDDTLALVSCLDLVISVQTCAAHASGAVGTETWVLNAHPALWRYGIEGEEYPWLSDVKIIRPNHGDTLEEKWKDVINTAHKRLKLKLES